jgi:hypothetical protein
VKIKLTKIEAKAIESARLVEAQAARDVQALDAQIKVLEGNRNKIVAAAESNSDETLACIAERVGLKSIPLDGLKLEKHKDGTATIECADPANPVLDAQVVEDEKLGKVTKLDPRDSVAEPVLEDEPVAAPV